jgi:hypothetical protein
MQDIATEGTDIAFIQEPYLYQNKIRGITSGYRSYTQRDGKKRAAIIISNNTIEAIQITQFSDEDTVLLEIQKGSKTFYAASVYMDYNDLIENNIKTIEKILDFTKGAKIIIAIDSNSRSKTWHDVTTNSRGKLLEEFVASNQLHIINEDSTRTTFQTGRGKSNIDITITNNQMLADVTNWEISEQESASDHNTIKFSIKLDNYETKINHVPGLRDIIKKEHQSNFYVNLHIAIIKTFQTVDSEWDKEDTDRELSRMLERQTDIRQFIHRLDEAIQTACRETTTHLKPPKSKLKGKTVPWWTDALKTIR